MPNPAPRYIKKEYSDNRLAVFDTVKDRYMYTIQDVIDLLNKPIPGNKEIDEQAVIIKALMKKDADRYKEISKLKKENQKLLELLNDGGKRNE